MFATPRTQMQAEYLELQLGTAAVGAGSTGTEHSGITWPGECVQPGNAHGEKRAADPLATHCSPSPPKTHILGHCC